MKKYSAVIVMMLVCSIAFAGETLVVTKASDTEINIVSTKITEQPNVPLKSIKQQKAQLESKKTQINIQIDEQIAILDKAIKDAEAQGVVEVKPK